MQYRIDMSVLTDSGFIPWWVELEAANEDEGQSVAAEIAQHEGYAAVRILSVKPLEVEDYDD